VLIGVVVLVLVLVLLLALIRLHPRESAANGLALRVAETGV
jgi:hypothetical protein